MLILSRSIGERVEVERLSLSIPGKLTAYKIKVGNHRLQSLTMNFSPSQLLGPTQTILGVGELSEGWSFRYKFRGSIWTEELKALTIAFDQWPVPGLLNKIGLSKYLLTPPTKGTIDGRLFRKRNSWDFRANTKGVEIDLSRIAAGFQLPRAFPSRSRVKLGEINVNVADHEVKFKQPLQMKSRMGTIYISGSLVEASRWEWDAKAYVKDAQVARAAYGYLLRCRELPKKVTFKILGPVQRPECI